MPIVQIERRWFTYDPEAPKLPSQKVKKKQKKVVVDDAAEGKRFKYMMDIVNAPKIKEGPISEEEKKRRFEIGRTYTIESFRRHNVLHHDLTCKIKLKNHAIKVLPRGSKIKEHALSPNNEMFPDDFCNARWFPNGFDLSEYSLEEEEEED